MPDDPDQVVYVWWDALANYITALEYGTDGDAYRRWWLDAAERVHVIGKGITRFHAVHWLALLLSAEQPLPTAIFVHDYLTADGVKLSKSADNAVDPVDVVSRYGSDALRWWLLREVARSGDTDFTTERLLSRYHQDLANGLGNLVNRTVSLVHRYRGGTVPDATTEENACTEVRRVCAGLPAAIDQGLAAFDFRAATEAISAVVVAANRLVESEQPWALAKSPRTRAQLEAVLATLVDACRAVSHELTPFLPDGAARVAAQLGDGANLPVATPVFPRLE